MAIINPLKTPRFASATCQKEVLYNNKGLTICKLPHIKDENNIERTTAHIDEFTFNNVNKKLFGSKYIFGPIDFEKQDFNTGINCIDIDWNGLEIDENTEINYTTDLLKYIKKIKNENDLLKQQLNNTTTVYVWDNDAINKFSNNYWIRQEYDGRQWTSAQGNCVHYLAKREYTNKWGKEITSTTTLPDYTVLTMNRVMYPASIADKDFMYSSYNNYESNATYVYPIEIYYVKDTTTNTVKQMSKRQFEHLTYLPSEYTTGVLTKNNKNDYKNYIETCKDPDYSSSQILNNGTRYIKLTNYLDLSKATLNGYNKTAINGVTKLQDINFTDIAYNKKFNVIYRVYNKITKQIEKMTRFEFNNLYAANKGNYIIYPYRHKTQNTYISENDYKILSDSEKPNYDKYCEYIFMDNLKNEWCSQLSDEEYNNLSSAIKANYIKFPIFDNEFPNNKYGYYTNDCVQNPLINIQDPNILQIISNTCLTFALAYTWFGDEDFYNKLIEQLDILFIDEDTKMNPHFKYSQYHPGMLYSYENYLYYVNTGTQTEYPYEHITGQPGGLIDTEKLVDILESIKLVNSIKPIDTERYIKYQEWFKELSIFMYEDLLGEIESKGKNNHVTNYWLNLYLFSKFSNMYSDDWGLMIDKFSESVNNQIDDEGRMPLELSRYNSLSYSVVNMRLILRMCRVIGKKQSIEKVGDKVVKAITFLNSVVNLTYEQFIAKGYTESNKGNYNNLIDEIKLLVNMFNKIWTHDSLLKDYEINDEYFYKEHRNWVTY